MNPDDPIAQAIDADFTEGMSDPSRAGAILRMLPRLLGDQPSIQPQSGIPQTGQDVFADVGALAGQAPSGLPGDVRMGTNLGEVYAKRAGRMQRGQIAEQELIGRRADRTLSMIDMLSKAGPRGQNVMSLAPGSTAFDPNTGQPIYTAPDKPEKPGERWSEPYPMGGAMVQKNLDTGQIRQAVNRPPQVNVQVPVNLAQNKYAETVGGKTAETDIAQHDAAQSAVDNIAKLDVVLNHLNTSDAITGMGADLLKNVERAKVLFLDAKKAGKKVSDTEYLDALLGSDVFPMIKQLGVGARGLDTPAEREFMRQVLSGTIQMNKETLIRMTKLRRDISMRSLERWNSRVRSGGLNKFFEASQAAPEEIPLPQGGAGGGGWDAEKERRYQELLRKRGAQ